MNRIVGIVFIIVLAMTAIGAAGLDRARRAPLVRRGDIGLADWPVGAAPVRVALLSDIHLGNASTGTDRLARVVTQVNALRPDLVIIAGDFVAGYDAKAARRQARALTAPLRALGAPLGTVAVLGNHDNWTAPAIIARSLRAAGVTVVENDAVRRGPLIIGGSGDTVSGHARLGGALNAMRRLTERAPGAHMFVSHSPDIVRWLPSGPGLLLAGHTHCGQIMVPVIGSVSMISQLHGDRYRCGVVRDGRRTTIITAGIGTSNVPLRFGAPPDLWLLTLGPEVAGRSGSDRAPSS